MAMLLLLLPGGVSWPGSADEPEPTGSGIILSLPPEMVSRSGDPVSVLDINPLLSLSGAEAGLPHAVSLFSLQAGVSSPPRKTGPGFEGIYILEGSGTLQTGETRSALSAGDSILIRAGEPLVITAGLDGELRFLSVVSHQTTDPGIQSAVIIRRSGTILPVTLGDPHSTPGASITRIFSPLEESLPLSFDLALVTLPKGGLIGDHILESGQTAYILSGEGMVTITCIPSRIVPGDLIHIPPGAVQRYEADEDLRFLLITDPYYQPDLDHPAASGC